MAEYPKDWKVVKLGDVGEPLMCKRILKEQTSALGDVPFYKIGTFGKEADAFISRALYEEFRLKYSYPSVGSVLISAAGTIGRLVVFDGKDAYFQDSNIVWLDNDETLVLNKYLFWSFQDMKWQTEDGGIISRLYNNNLRTMQIVLPPLPEQKRIADVLSTADKLIENVEKRIAKKRAIKQGAMQELLGNGEQGTGNGVRRRLPGFTGEWKSVLLGTIADIRTGKRNGDEQKADGQYPFFVRSQEVCRIDTFSYDGEAIMIPGEGGIGTIFHYINGRFDFHQRVYKISDFPKWVSCKYVYYFMRQFFGKYALQNTVKATVDSLRLPTFQKFKVAMPPTIEEQRAIAKILSDMDEEISNLERKLEKLKLMKKGMMQDLLTGKVRLKEAS